MKLHALRHEVFEGIGSIGDWADANGVEVGETMLCDGDALPDLEEFDVLLVMGGSMGVDDIDEHPWLEEEKVFIESAIDDGKFIIGICLGAQLVASVLGARVYPAGQKEIGWLSVKIEDGARQSELFPELPESLTVFQWHGDVFDLPEGTECVALSEACPQQGFILDDRVIGLQFHLEMTPAGVADLIENCDAALEASEFVQDEATIKAANFNCDPTNDILAEILDRIQAEVEDDL